MSRAIIIGGGRSGSAAAKLAESLGMETVIVSDDECKKLQACDLIIASPGVPPLKSELYRQAMDSGTEFIGELEFGFRHWSKPLLAVTGTNGKTTVTELLTHLLNGIGVKAASAGNIGRPLCDLALTPDDAEVAVVEVSNFQLELAPTFSPGAAVLLNLASDHVDRYAGGFEEYCAVKRSIFRHVAPENQVWGLSFPEWKRRRVGVAGKRLFIDGAPLLMMAETDLPGPHNAENLSAAVELLLRYAPNVLTEKRGALISAIRSFRRDAHRIETVAVRNGVTYVDDSKGTNPAAVLAAIDSFPGKLVMMMGGLAKGMDFSPLAAKAERFRQVVLFGKDRAVLAQVLADKVPCVDCGSDFTAAFQAAVKAAQPGDTVLLSPGCASMDMFKDYAERGDTFRCLALALEAR